MISFEEHKGILLLNYTPGGWNDSRWLDEKLKSQSAVTLRRTFTFGKKTLYLEADEDDQERTFVMGSVEDGYNRINKDVLGLKYDLLIATSISLNIKLFVANRNISIFRKIDELIEEPIVIGGEKENAIPETEFRFLLKMFPTTTELTHYARSRVSRILKDYLNTISDAEAKLNIYLSRNKLALVSHRPAILDQSELLKFEYVLDEMKEMLRTTESYVEEAWQRKILQLLLYIFPKYIAVLENVHIKDFYSKSDRATSRYVDLMLVDASGNIDIVEIKRPHADVLLPNSTHRGNYTPRKALSDTVMQAEKYLFHLSKWGRVGEQEIFEKQKHKLPEGIELKITNPKAMIMIGRDHELTKAQRFDFEIIRRKYANVMDIMTYDDLLRRLDNIIATLKRSISNSSDNSHSYTEGEHEE